MVLGAGYNKDIDKELLYINFPREERDEIRKRTILDLVVLRIVQPWIDGILSSTTGHFFIIMTAVILAVIVIWNTLIRSPKTKIF
jgi:hypothetical protein